MSISECGIGRSLLGKVVISTSNLETLKKQPVGTVYENRSRIEQFNLSKQLWRHVNGCDICNETRITDTRRRQASFDVTIDLRHGKREIASQA
jgi:hypothetical protein